MRKLATKISTGMRFRLPIEWQQLVFNTNMSEDFSNELIIEKNHKKGKKNYYVCYFEKKINNETVRIVLTQDVAKYLLGEEIEDSNEGFSFKEIIPKVGEELLVTNNRNLTEIVPGVLKLDVGLIAVEDESLKYLYFSFEFSIGNCCAELSYFSKRNAHYTWKLLNFPDESYMTNYEKVFKDTIIHKNYVIKSAELLSQYLRENGSVIHADLLEERAKIHDNSKITNVDELESLSKIINDKTNLKNPTKKLSKIKIKSIELHWAHNPHHPEYHNSVLDMSRLDILEMCSDWHARSVQYGTNLMEFVEKQNEKRFHFPSWMLAEIKHYCEVLQSKNI